MQTNNGLYNQHEARLPYMSPSAALQSFVNNRHDEDTSSKKKEDFMS
jgi:hypothetical protein